MIDKLISLLKNLKERIPLYYSLVLIILVPVTLIVNTLWNLRSFERDMEFVVREEAITVQRMFLTFAEDRALDNTFFEETLPRIQAAIPKIISMSVLKPDEKNDFQVIASTNTNTAEQDAKSFLNQFAWGEEDSVFTQSYDNLIKQNVWTVVSPLLDESGTKVGLVNFKFSSLRVDSVITRTTRDSLIILFVSVSFVVLLLINHSRFFEQSLMYEKLKEIDQMKDDFISVASHELRTPLTSIKGYLSMLEKDLGGMLNEKMQKRINVINNSLKRLEQLVEDLLNVSRIEQDRLDFTLTPINSSTVIQETIEQLLPNAESKGLALIFDPLPNAPLVLANKNRLHEVLLNLVGNAIKYTPKGQVTIEQSVEDKELKVDVKDTGLGIAPEDQERLFQKFSRIQDEDTLDIPGTGLGLWITRQIVENMQGKIYVSSIKGQGSVFTIILKQAQPKNPPS